MIASGELVEDVRDEREDDLEPLGDSLRAAGEVDDERAGTLVARVDDADEDMSFLELMDVLNEKLILDGEEPVDAASALLIMTLGAEKGTEVTVESDSQEAVDVIADLVRQDLDAE